MDNSLQDRARRLLTGPAVSPKVELVSFSMNCSIYVKPFVAVAHREGNRLTVVRNESLLGGRQTGNSALAHLGSFSLGIAPTWPGCPYCHTVRNLGHYLCWMCPDCQAQGRPGTNCVGCDSQRRYRCACGLVSMGDFVPTEILNVFGGAALPAGTPQIVGPYVPTLPGPTMRRLKG